MNLWKRKWESPEHIEFERLYLEIFSRNSTLYRPIENIIRNSLDALREPTSRDHLRDAFRNTLDPIRPTKSPCCHFFFCHGELFHGMRFIISIEGISRIEELSPCFFFLHLTNHLLYGLFPFFFGVLFVENTVRLILESDAPKNIRTRMTLIAVEIVYSPVPTSSTLIEIAYIESDIDTVIWKSSIISPHTDIHRILRIIWIRNIKNILTITDIIALISILRIIAKISSCIYRACKDISLQSYSSYKFSGFRLKISTKMRIFF